MTTAPRAHFADELAGFVDELSFDSVPVEILDRARDRVLDAVSTALAARTVATTQVALGAAASFGIGEPICTVLPTGAVAGLEHAAFVNGAAVHAILFEDINLSSADHPGAVIVPAALAAAEAAAGLVGRPASIGDLVLGVLAGYEVHLWLGAIAADGVRARGLRTTSIFGTVGAAAAAAKVLGLDQPTCATALTMGANVAFGLLEGFAHGGMEPYLHAGLAAKSGLVAALLGRAGALTAGPSFEGPHGYFRAFGDLDPGTSAEHGDWRITGVTAKPYPISGGKIGSVDSALGLVGSGIDVAAIDRIVVRLAPGIKEFPGADLTGPFRNMNQAQDSTQFCVAAALLGYEMGALETVRDRFADAPIATLASRIELVSEPGRHLARVDATMIDGRVVSSEVDWSHLQVPSIDAMAAKLRRLTTECWAPGRADRVVEVLCGTPDGPISELSGLLRG